MTDVSSDRSTPGSQTSLREANRARIVNAVKRHGGLTQVELAGATGLSPATVSTIIKELTAAGVVDTAVTSRSGRRAQQVTLAQRAGLVAGVHIAQRQLRVSIGDFTNSVVASQRMPLPHDHRIDTALDQACLLISDLLESVGSSLAELGGVGLAVPAPIDPSTGIISIAGVLRGWDGVSLSKLMSTRLGRPVHVENDANLGALAECRFGAGQGGDPCLYILASHSVGAGMIVDGALFHGFAGTAGEIGHIRVDPNGPICRCGNRGCLDTEVNSAALVDLLRVSHGNLSFRDVIRKATQGDPGCRRVIADAGRAIGVVVAGACALLNPRRVVVGGELAATGDIFIDPLRDALERWLTANTVAPLEIKAGVLGDQAEVLGALALAQDRADVVTEMGRSVADG